MKTKKPVAVKLAKLANDQATKKPIVTKMIVATKKPVVKKKKPIETKPETPPTDNQEISDLELKLSQAERDFCEYYLFGFEDEIKGETKKISYNAMRAYAKASGKDPNNKKQMEVCKVMGFKWLTRVNMKQYMRVLLDRNGFNDEVVDRETLNLVHSDDYRAKKAGIEIYNGVRGRQIKKVEHDVSDPLQNLLRELAK